MRLSDLYDPAFWQEALAAILEARYGSMLTAVHRLVESWLMTQDPVAAASFRLDDEATRAILAEAAERVVLIDHTTREALRDQFQEGQKRGYSTYQLAYGEPREDFRGIDGLFRVTWKGRAETVARTELANASLTSARDRYAATGLVERLRVVENEDTDAPCAAWNGRVVPLSEAPGLEHPNCRRSYIPIVEEDAVA